MVCFGSRWLAAGIVVCIAAAAACGGKKEEGKSTDDKAGMGVSPEGNKDLDVIPPESDTVLGLDLAKAQQSGLFREFVLPMMMRSAEAPRVIELLKTKCNLDPMTAATRMTAGIKLAGKRIADVVAVVHGVPKAKALPCIDQVKDDLAAEKIEVSKDGDVVMLKGPQGDLAFTFTGDTTAVVAIGSKANKAGLLELAQGKSALKSSKEFTDMYGRLNTGHTVWFLVRGDVDMVANNLERIGVRSKAIFGSADTTLGLEVRATVRAETEEQAQKLVELGNSQATMAGRMSDKFVIDRDKADARAHVIMNPQQLKNALGLIGPFIR